MGGEWEEGGREVVRRLCYVVATPWLRDSHKRWLDYARMARSADPYPSDLRRVIQYLGQGQGQGELQDAKRPVVIGIGAAVAE